MTGAPAIRRIYERRAIDAGTTLDEWLTLNAARSSAIPSVFRCRVALADFAQAQGRMWL